MTNPLTYSQSADFPDGVCNPTNLAEELLGSSEIVTALRPGPVSISDDTVSVWFNTDPVAADVAAVSGIIVAHDSAQAVPEPAPTIRGIPVTRPAPYDPELNMCGRDFLLRTCVVEPSSSFEDLYIDPATNSLKDWGELEGTGVYRKNASGIMVLCESQAVADASGICSTWLYQARDPQTASGIAYEATGGSFIVKDDLDAPELEHQVYVVGAPSIPGSMGGSIRFFDGYLASFVGGELNCENVAAAHLDPTHEAGDAGAQIGFWVYHPSGCKHNHFFRLKTFRPNFSFP